MLKTFADQAVIAIQNARLFNETQEALAHQTASADILRVISSSPTDVQPVFEAIVDSGRRLLNCTLATVLRTDGQTFQQVAWPKADGSRMRTVGRLRPVDPDHDFPSRVIVQQDRAAPAGLDGDRAARSRGRGVRRSSAATPR